MILLNRGGKNWAGPFFPPSKMLGSFYLYSRLFDYVILLLYLNSILSPLLNLSIFYWSFRLSVYVTLSLYFNIYERPIPKWETSFQSNKIIGTVNPLYNDDVCPKLSLTLKWISCYKEMPTITRFPHHNHLVKEKSIQMNLNASIPNAYIT